MKTLGELKSGLDFNKDLSGIIVVLKNVAVSQYRALERKLKGYEELSHAICDFFSSFDLKKVSHPFLTPRNNSQLILVVTSDAGLLGGLNVQAVEAALYELSKIPGKLVIIGERGKVYARSRGFGFTSFPGISEGDRLTQSIEIRNYLTKRFLKESMGYLKVIYPHPVSFTVQRIQTVDFCPFTLALIENFKGYAFEKNMIFESRIEDIVEYLFYLWMGAKLFELFGLSRLSEFAARFVHLEESSEKLKDLDKKLRLEYFRARHELIDRNMRELFSARLLYAE